MKSVLSDYLEIYNKFRTDGLSKSERKRFQVITPLFEKNS